MTTAYRWSIVPTQSLEIIGSLPLVCPISTLAHRRAVFIVQQWSCFGITALKLIGAPQQRFVRSRILFGLLMAARLRLRLHVEVVLEAETGCCPSRLTSVQTAVKRRFRAGSPHGREEEIVEMKSKNGWWRDLFAPRMNGGFVILISPCVSLRRLAS